MVDVYDMASKLEVDEVILSRMNGREPRILVDLSVPYVLATYFRGEFHRGMNAPEIPAVMIARRTLECALGFADGRKAMTRQESAIKNWRNLGTEAAHGAMRLDRVLKNLAGRSMRQDLSKSDFDAVAASNLAMLWNNTSENEQTGRDLRSTDSSIRISALNEALQILTEIDQRASALAQRIRADRQNPGKLGKAGFVWTMAEGWQYVTGRKPGRQKDNTKNSFLRFVEAGWRDAGRGRESFSAYLNSIDDLGDQVPSWL